jgi:plastocyanin
MGTTLLLLAAAPPRSAGDGHAVVIGQRVLEPPTLSTTVGERVTFVNRTGRSVHVEFDAMPTGHRIFELSGEIWAVFHRPGRHPYIVHFFAGRAADLRGAVEGREDPEAGPQTCAGLLTVMGECLEP